MRRVRMQAILAAIAPALGACAGAGRSSAEAGAGETAAGVASVAPVVQSATMVLHYPHDEHTLGELPPDLAPVEGATAELERHGDRVSATFDTRIAPGHVAKLIGVVLNNPDACQVPTPGTACGPHEEEYNQAADGGFYLGSGAVADSNGRVRLTLTARVGDASNVLCGGAANPEFDPCANGFALRDPHGAEVTLVVLDNGPAAEDPAVRAQQLAAPSPCPECPSFTAQIAIGFGRDGARAPRTMPARSANPAQVFERYVEAANRHDFAQVRALIADDAVWHLGPDTLAGPDALLRPHQFDQGARTMLEVENVRVSGDTVDFDLTERNDVLTALGVPILHHRVRMIIGDGLIRQISPHGPPLEWAAFADSIVAFRNWLRSNDLAAYDRIWPGEEFNYSRATGEQLPALIAEWRRRR